MYPPQAVWLCKPEEIMDDNPSAFVAGQGAEQSGTVIFCRSWLPEMYQVDPMCKHAADKQCFPVGE
jgi:hypothetical protein